MTEFPKLSSAGLRGAREEGKRQMRGYYGCKLPPGACSCPQDARKYCANSHWVERKDKDADV